MCLIVVDTYSKWPEAKFMTSTTTTPTVETSRDKFAAHGIPAQVVSDNGPQFVSDELKFFLSKNEIKHSPVPKYHPQSNGAAERSVQIVKGILKKYLVNDELGCNVKVPIQHRLDNFNQTHH